MKTKSLNESQFLALLEKALPKATDDPHLASAIFAEVTKELRLIKSLQSFEKFCEEGGLPDAKPETVADLQRELADQFGADNVELTTSQGDKSIEVVIDLPDRVVNNKVKVDPALAEPEPVKAPFVCFPVVLPEDPELVWVLGRREDLAPEEASRALARIETEFWETKKGVELQRGGTDKCFAEFINHVPAAMLGDCGLKRHYKDPETLHTLRAAKQVDPLEALNTKE